MGGEQKMQSILSMEMDLVITTPKGDVPAKIKLKNGMAYRFEIGDKTAKNIKIINQRGLFEINPSKNDKSVKGVETLEYEAQKGMTYLYELLGYKMQGKEDKLEFMGSDKLDGLPVYVFKIRTENPELYTIYYLDEVKRSIIKKTIFYPTNEGAKEITTTYSKYLKSNYGVMYPSEFSTEYGMAKVKSIKFNSEINDKEFEF